MLSRGLGKIRMFVKVIAKNIISAKYIKYAKSMRYLAVL